MTAQRVVTSAGERTSHYSGNGYQYFYSTDPQKGRQCKMQVPAAMFQAFQAGVGRINSVGLPHLEVLDQGNGWVLICSDRPENDSVVTQFIARFNRWALSKADGKPAPTPAPAKRVYTIQVKNHGHPQPTERRSSAQPMVADQSALQDLQAKINEKYGHTRRK